MFLVCLLLGCVGPPCWFRCSNPSGAAVHSWPCLDRPAGSQATHTVRGPGVRNSAREQARMWGEVKLCKMTPQNLFLAKEQSGLSAYQLHRPQSGSRAKGHVCAWILPNKWLTASSMVDTLCCTNASKGWPTLGLATSTNEAGCTGRTIGHCPTVA